MLTGCSARAGGQDLEVVNNRLREQNLDLREQVAALEQQNAELRIALEQKAQANESTAANLDENIPRVTSITLGGLSGFATNSDGLMVRAYLKPEDGRGRFTQLAGRVTLKLVRVPEGDDAETVAERSFEPADVREAYRSSFTGTHYTFELPVTLPAERAGESWLLIATYEDIVTGTKLKAEEPIEPPNGEAKS